MKSERVQVNDEWERDYMIDENANTFKEAFVG